MDQQKFKFAATLPRKMAKLLHQNHALKLLTLGAYLVSMMCLAYTVTMSNKGPVIIPLDREGSRVGIVDSMSWTKDMVEEAVKEYLSYRYSWNPKNQSAQMTTTKKFISDGSRSAFDRVAHGLLQFSKDKSVSQRVYLTDIKIDTEKNVATVVADRFNEIQGLKAATVLNVKIYFERGRPSLENPWGFYVTKEEELVSQ